MLLPKTLARLESSHMDLKHPPAAALTTPDANRFERGDLSALNDRTAAVVWGRRRAKTYDLIDR